MPLVRIFPSLGSVIVPRQGGDGGAPPSRVSAELDNLINWARNAPRNILRFAPDPPVGNVGAGGDELHSFTLDTPNRLLTNGDYLTIDYGGSFAANDNNKRVLAYFDGQAYEDGLGAPQDLDGGGANGWRFFNRIIRVDSTHVRIHSLFAAQFLLVDSTGAVSVPANAGFIHLNRSQLFTVSNLNSNPIVLKVEGEATANNDVVIDMAIIELSQQ